MNRQADGSYLLGLYTSDGNGPGTSSRSLGFGASAGAGGIPWAQQEQEDFMNAQKDEEEEGTWMLTYRRDCQGRTTPVDRNMIVFHSCAP
jgi:hypothetical protein